MAYVPGFIDRTFSLSEHEDYQRNVSVFEGEYQIDELLDSDQNLIGWTLKRM